MILLFLFIFMPHYFSVFVLVFLTDCLSYKSNFLPASLLSFLFFYLTARSLFFFHLCYTVFISGILLSILFSCQSLCHPLHLPVIHRKKDRKSFYVSTHFSLHPPVFHDSVFLSLFLPPFLSFFPSSTFPFSLSVFLFIFLPPFLSSYLSFILPSLSVFLSFFPSSCLPIFFPSSCLPFCFLSFFSSSCLSFSLPVFLPIFLHFFHLPTSLSLLSHSFSLPLFLFLVCLPFCLRMIT